MALVADLWTLADTYGVSLDLIRDTVEAMIEDDAESLGAEADDNRR